MPEFQVEMLWRCPGCKTEVKGREKACTGCGRDKTEAEEFYMPGHEITFQDAVTDPELLKHAEAGADWSCRFCGSSRRRLDGECAKCGAEKSVGEKTPPAVESPPRPVPAVPTRADLPRREARELRERSSILKPVAIGAGILAIVIGIWAMLRPTRMDGTVETVRWQYDVEVEHRVSRSDEGWIPPGEAFDVHSLGEREHHKDHVQVGSHVEHYTETYKCGETCAKIPRTCRTVPKTCKTTPKNCTKTPVKCESNKNGFASCKGGDEVCTGGNEICTGGNEVCTGGGETCTPKMCDRERSKTVEDYQDVPRYAPWYGWNVWRWEHARTISEAGTSAPHWPSGAKIQLNADEREGGHTERYEVVFRTTDGKAVVYRPSRAAEFESYRAKSRYTLETGPLGVSVLGLAR